MSEIYDIEVLDKAGQTTSLKNHSGKVMLIVNTASKCGFTPQFEGLEELHKTYKDNGLVIIGFPCNQFGKQDPGSQDEIESFCQINYGVTFPIMKKIEVNGPDAAPLFSYLKDQARGIMGSQGIKWNFTKFLVGKDGEVIKRYAPKTKPAVLKADIETLLKA